MGELTIWERVKSCLGWIGWKLFIWSYSGAKEDYWRQIYEYESVRRGIKPAPDLDSPAWTEWEDITIGGSTIAGLASDGVLVLPLLSDMERAGPREKGVIFDGPAVEVRYE